MATYQPPPFAAQEDTASTADLRALRSGRIPSRRRVSRTLDQDRMGVRPQSTRVTSQRCSRLVPASLPLRVLVGKYRKRIPQICQSRSALCQHTSCYPHDAGHKATSRNHKIPSLILHWRAADRVCARDLADAVGFCDISGQIEYLTRYTAAGISEIRRVGYVEGFQPLLNRIRVNPAANGFGSVEWKDYGGCRVRWDADGKAMLALLPIGDDGSVFRVILHV